MITVETILAAFGTLAGLSALIVVLTQILKNIFNKEDKKWLSHLLSFITSIVCCFAVLAAGIWGHAGMWANFCTSCWLDWVLWVCTIFGCTLISNGMWTYDIMKKFLELIKLLKKDE